MRRSIILKAPVLRGGVVHEKGVLLLKFTNTFEYYIRHIDLPLLLADYYLVLEPSWSGYFDPRILYWMRFSQHEVIVEASEPKDFELTGKLGSNLIPAEFGASDWVDDRIFHPIDTISKKYDAVYVASYGAYKRHHLLFKAMKKLDDPTLRVALVGSPWEATRSEIRLLIDHYGLADNIDLFENISPTEVNEILNMSKVNILLSLREGSNKSIFEGFFAGTPAIVLRRNIGVHKQYINEMTGMLIEDAELPAAISHFRTHWGRYQPRQWAQENISPPITTRKLNGMLRDIALRDNMPWTDDIAVKVNAPELLYYDDMDESRINECARIIEDKYELR